MLKYRRTKKVKKVNLPQGVKMLKNDLPHQNIFNGVKLKELLPTFNNKTQAAIISN